MTKDEWDGCYDPKALLDYLTISPLRYTPRVTERQKFFLAAEICRLCHCDHGPLAVTGTFWPNWVAGEAASRGYDLDLQVDNASRFIRGHYDAPDRGVVVGLIKDLVRNPCLPDENLDWVNDQVVDLADAVRRPYLGAVVVVRDVVDAQNSPIACCMRHADNCACDCLANAWRAVPWHLDDDGLLVLADACEEAGCPSESCWACDGAGRHVTGYVRCDVRGVNDSRYRIKCALCGGSGRLPSPLLKHLRSGGPHSLGCWAVEMLMRKE